MDKNKNTNKPNAGTVADRLACKDLMSYAAPDGKRVLSYGKVCQLLSIDQDLAVAEAYKAGVTISDEQWVIKQGKGKGKKSPKTAAVTDSSSSSESETDESASSPKQQKKARKYKTKKLDTGPELIAELVRQTSTEIPALLVEVGEELKEMCTATPAPAPSPPTSPKKVKKVKKEKKKKDPKAPKRAPSAYNLFIQDKENRSKYPEASAKEIMSKLSADWKALNQTQKEVWTEKAVARKAQMTVTPAPAVAETPLPVPISPAGTTPVPCLLPALRLQWQDRDYSGGCAAPLPTPAPVVETPLPAPTPAPVVETPLPARVVEGYEHLKKDFPELELDEYIGTCVTDGEETEDEGNEGDVVIETLIHKGVTYYKDSEGLVYDGEDTQVGVWDPATENVEFLYG